MKINSIDIDNLIEYQKKNYSYIEGVWLYDLSKNSNFPSGRLCSICGKWYEMRYIRNDNGSKFGKSSMCVICAKSARNKFDDVVLHGNILHDTTGIVYFISSTNKVKIGVTANPENLLSRFRYLQFTNPQKLDLLGIIQSKEYTKIEKELHKRFSEYRSHAEWFFLSEDIIRYIKENTIKINLTNKILK